MYILVRSAACSYSLSLKTVSVWMTISRHVRSRYLKLNMSESVETQLLSGPNDGNLPIENCQ